MTKLLVKNSKIAKSNDDDLTIYNYGIPALKTVIDGKEFITCPMAGECAEGCYAQMGPYAWENVNSAYKFRLMQSFKLNFPDLLQQELNPKIKTALRKQKQLVIRIHDSGDFYDLSYIKKWLKIIQANPTVKFYAYTKQVIVFKKMQEKGQIPDNFTLIFSEGGKADHMIDTTTDRHSRVFLTESDLISAGYDDASENDTVAFNSLTGKIGLIYHGYKSKEWTTDQ